MILGVLCLLWILCLLWAIFVVCIDSEIPKIVQHTLALHVHFVAMVEIEQANGHQQQDDDNAAK